MSNGKRKKVIHVDKVIIKTDKVIIKKHDKKHDRKDHDRGCCCS
ncbi:hypothetical protein AB3N02_31360 [Priestia aryabhattai]